MTAPAALFIRPSPRAMDRLSRATEDDLPSRVTVWVQRGDPVEILRFAEGAQPLLTAFAHALLDAMSESESLGARVAALEAENAVLKARMEPYARRAKAAAKWIAAAQVALEDLR